LDLDPVPIIQNRLGADFTELRMTCCCAAHCVTHLPATVHPQRTKAVGCCPTFWFLSLLNVPKLL